MSAEEFHLKPSLSVWEQQHRISESFTLSHRIEVSRDEQFPCGIGSVTVRLLMEILTMRTVTTEKKELSLIDLYVFE